MQKSKPVKITIVGAGIPGLSLALILAKVGIHVTVIEKNKLPAPADIKPSGRTTACMQNSLAVLEKADVWPDFKQHTTPLQRLSIIDDSDYPRGIENMVRQDFDADELDYDHFGYNIPLGLLTATLADKAKAHENINLLDNTDIAQTDDGITQADLVVGADGRHSIVREWTGIDADEKHYDQSAITCLISHTGDHNKTSTEFHRPGGPCTFVPCGEGQSAVVWVEKTEDAEELIKLPKSAFVQALQARTRDILGQIDLVAGPECWPLMTLKAERLAGPKTVLIAEAAHVLSPIGAQGLNLSLRDVDVLSDILIKAFETGQDVGSATTLKAYERQRRRDISTRHLGVDIFNRMVANDNPLMKAARRLGLRAIGLGGPLRKILMEQGLAPKS